jgi:hypothetical protein
MMHGTYTTSDGGTFTGYVIRDGYGNLIAQSGPHKGEKVW